MAISIYCQANTSIINSLVLALSCFSNQTTHSRESPGLWICEMSRELLRTEAHFLVLAHLWCFSSSVLFRRDISFCVRLFFKLFCSQLIETVVYFVTMDSDSSPTKKGSKNRGRGRGTSTTASSRGRSRGRGRGKRAVKVFGKVLSQIYSFCAINFAILF